MQAQPFIIITITNANKPIKQETSCKIPWCRHQIPLLSSWTNKMHTAIKVVPKAWMWARDDGSIMRVLTRASSTFTRQIPDSDKALYYKFHVASRRFPRKLPVLAIRRIYFEIIVFWKYSFIHPFFPIHVVCNLWCRVFFHMMSVRKKKLE